MEKASKAPNKMERLQSRWEDTKADGKLQSRWEDTKGTRVEGKGTAQMGRHKQVELGNFQTR